MKSISYRQDEWHRLWDKLAKEYSALSIGQALGVTLRRESKILNCDDAPVGVEEIIIHLDFTRDEDYTLFVLKYR